MLSCKPCARHPTFRLVLITDNSLQQAQVAQRKEPSMHGLLRGIKLKKLWFLIPAAAIFLGACSSQPAAKDPPAKTNAILILSTQSGNSSVDPVVFNSVVRNVTQAFAKDLAVVLKKKGIKPINVLDQTQKYTVAQKMVLYSAIHKVNRAVVMTIRPEVVKGDQRLQLQVQYIDENVVVKDGKIKSARILSTINRIYTLNGYRTEASAKHISAMVAEFVKTLEVAKRL